MQLTITRDTYLKSRPFQSSELDDRQKTAVSAGTQFDIDRYQPSPNNHINVVMNDGTSHHVFVDHVSIVGNQANNNPIEKPSASQPKTGAFKLPGFTSTFYLSDPIIPRGNFTWSEATRNGSRLPADVSIVENILGIAKVMQAVRGHLGDRAITVTSWYRPPAVNRRVGGASGSYHILGKAVDFAVAGLPPAEVYKRLDPWWGNRGGLASARGFTHIDDRGGRARWRY